MASGERDIGKRTATNAVDRDIHRIILKEFGRPEDEGYGPAYRRFFEEYTARFSLSQQDYLELAEEERIALQDRLARREGRKIQRDLTRAQQAGITESVIEYQKQRLKRES